MGRHSVKTGFDYRIINDSGIADRDAGRVHFQPAFTSASATSTVAGTGASLASMLLGFPRQAVSRHPSRSRITWTITDSSFTTTFA